MTQGVYIHDIQHVVIDNLQFMMGMDYNELNRWIRQDHIVSAFRQFATDKNCHVTLIMHPRKVGCITVCLKPLKGIGLFHRKK